MYTIPTQLVINGKDSAPRSSFPAAQLTSSSEGRWQRAYFHPIDEPTSPTSPKQFLGIALTVSLTVMGKPGWVGGRRSRLTIHCALGSVLKNASRSDRDNVLRTMAVLLRAGVMLSSTRSVFSPSILVRDKRTEKDCSRL